MTFFEIYHLHDKQQNQKFQLKRVGVHIYEEQKHEKSKKCTVKRGGGVVIENNRGYLEYIER